LSMRLKSRSDAFCRAVFHSYGEEVQTMEPCIVVYIEVHVQTLR